jgi:hypothetical protein
VRDLNRVEASFSRIIGIISPLLPPLSRSVDFVGLISYSSSPVEFGPTFLKATLVKPALNRRVFDRGYRFSRGGCLAVEKKVRIDGLKLRPGWLFSLGDFISSG